MSHLKDPRIPPFGERKLWLDPPAPPTVFKRGMVSPAETRYDIERLLWIAEGHTGASRAAALTLGMAVLDWIGVGPTADQLGVLDGDNRLAVARLVTRMMIGPHPYEVFRHMDITDRTRVEQIVRYYRDNPPGT